MFIYRTVPLYMFQFVSCVCKLHLTFDVELLQYIKTSVLWFLVVVEG